MQEKENRKNHIPQGNAGILLKRELDILRIINLTLSLLTEELALSRRNLYHLHVKGVEGGIKKW